MDPRGGVPISVEQLRLTLDAGRLSHDLRVVGARLPEAGDGVLLDVEREGERATLLCLPRDDARGFLVATDRVALSILGDGSHAMAVAIREVAPRLDGMRLRHRLVQQRAASGGESVAQRWERVLDETPGGLKLTDLCEERCAFCSSPADRLLGEGAHAPLESVYRRLERWSAEGLRTLELLGREPTLYPHLIEVVARARALGFRVIRLNSNGLSLADPDRVRSLAAAGLTDLCLSLHATDARRSDAITAREGGFSRKLQALRNALGARVKTAVNFVVTRGNAAEMAPFVRFIDGAFEGPRPEIVFSFVAPVGDAERDPALLPSLAALREHLTEALDLRLGLVALHANHGVPPCAVAPRHRAQIAASCRPDARRVFAAPCLACAFRPGCSGVWPAHLARYGESDLDPTPAPPTGLRPSG